ncbi:hypothetical protein ABEB36_013907 [Hypothenemus hampei]|uniref:Peptidase S1 domain-containing protein n=1 Tax=Hypothenemus hampei TaxID=57062 RepID=A0ABD1E5Y6_HYPHA
MYHSPKVTNFSTNNNTPIVMIYGGKDSEEKEFPHMAALGYGEQSDNEFFCGGSLILENFVLTAAHCLVSKIGPVRYVKLGIVDLFQSSSNNVQILNVMQTFQHEQYNSNTQYHDIALLKLNGSVVITDYVRPICLFSSNNYEDRNIVATGWGKTENEAVSVNLQKVGLELFTQRECQVAYQNVPKEHLPLGIQESIQICAGSHSKNSDTCQGDSGGPIQIRKNNRWYLIGITSVGLQCGIVNSPGVYTRISAYFSWIKERISN